MAREPSEEELALVAKHGEGQFERALAIVQLAKRRGREEDLHRLINERDIGPPERNQSG